MALRHTSHLLREFTRLSRTILATGVMAFTLGGLTLASAQEAQQPESTMAVAQKKSVSAKSFMVSAANPIACQIGYDVLSRGGSAMDAAVAVQFALNLVEPQSSGIGGGAFLLHWDATARKLTSYDGREKAPMAASPDYWLDDNGNPVKWFDAVVGGRSVGVPGTLKLLEVAHQRFGTQDWATLIEPTRQLAEKGFAVSPRLSGLIAKSAGKRKLDLFEPTKSYFFDQDGQPLKAGHHLKNPAFAATLADIQKNGSGSFYHGDLAKQIVAATQTPINPGILTAQDMTDYAVVERAPVCLPYRGYEICGMGPPSSGGLTVGQILGLLERFDLAKMGPGAQADHLYAEAAKLAYADRALYMADSDFVPLPGGLLNKGYLSERSGLIDPKKAIAKAKAGTPPQQTANRLAPDTQLERPGTSHFSIVDAAGNVVSMTTTIETGFGSRVMVGGFLLNNELTDFSRAPSKDGKMIANRVEAGKRPRSSMAPTIVLKDGKPVLVIGSPGGSRIINYVARNLIAILDHGMDPQVAINRGHVVNRNGATDLEQDTEATQLAPAMEALGQSIKVRNLNSGLHVIQIKDSKLIGAADPRREGLVLGE